MLRPHDRHDPHGELGTGRDQGPQPAGDDDPLADRDQLMRGPEVEGAPLPWRLAVTLRARASPVTEDPERPRVPVRIIRRGTWAGGRVIDEQPPLVARL